MHDDVPLVVSEVNPEALEGHKGIVANPNCSTMQMVVALKPLHDAAGIERLVVSTYQAVSGTGKAAIDELREQSHAILHGQEASASIYPHQIAFNVLAQAGSFADGDDHTDEERKLIGETRKILGDRRSGQRHLRPRAGRHRPLRGGQRADPRAAQRRRARASCWPPRPASPSSTTPPARASRWRSRRPARTTSSSAASAADASNPSTLDLWVVADNLRKGAATNAVQIAELLVERDLLRP